MVLCMGQIIKVYREPLLGAMRAHAIPPRCSGMLELIWEGPRLAASSGSALGLHGLVEARPGAVYCEEGCAWQGWAGSMWKPGPG